MLQSVISNTATLTVDMKITSGMLISDCETKKLNFKCLHYSHKYTPFQELAIAQRIPRQSTVITMEYTEFLTIDCDVSDGDYI